MNLPVFEAKTIRQVPIYIRHRVRLVKELIKEANMKLAGTSKAHGVYDWSNHHK